MLAVFRGRRGFAAAFLSLAILLGSVLGLFSISTQSAGGGKLYVPETAVMTSFLQQTNELRLKNGLDPLIANKDLELSAIAKLDDMKAKNYWGHYGPGNSSFSAIIWDKKPEAKKVGENLARCFSTHERAFDGLLNSPTHYAVMVSDEFKYLGVASTKLDNGCESIAMHFSS